MKKIRLCTASFQNNNIELVINHPLSYEDYIIDVAYYNDENTASRKNSLHPRMKGKIPKMMEWFYFPGYDYYIWIDSKFVILKGFLQEMFNIDLSAADLYLFKHGVRSSIKDELTYMQNRMLEGSDYLLSRYLGEPIEEQVNYYLGDSSFHDHQLFAGGCFMYSSRLVVNENYNIMTDWLQHNALYSIQDQLSLPYLIHKHQVKYGVYQTELMNNSFLNYRYSF